MADVILQHRGAPGTKAVIKYQPPQEVPQSSWHARQMKRDWTKKFKGDAKIKRQQINKKIKDLLAQRKRVKHSAKSKIRDKHLEIDKAYRTGGKGFRWSEFAKGINWRKQRGRPIGSTGQKALSNDNYIDTDYITHEEPLYLPQGHTVVTPVDTYRPALPPVTRPALISGPSPKVIEPVKQILPPVTRQLLPEPRPLKQVGPPKERPELGPHIRGLLPAAGETTMRLKMNSLKKKIAKK